MIHRSNIKFLLFVLSHAVGSSDFSTLLYGVVYMLSSYYTFILRAFDTFQSTQCNISCWNLPVIIIIKTFRQINTVFKTTTQSFVLLYTLQGCCSYNRHIPRLSSGDCSLVAGLKCTPIVKGVAVLSILQGLTSSGQSESPQWVAVQYPGTASPICRTTFVHCTHSKTHSPLIGHLRRKGC